jgi:peptide deformylase
LAILNILTYPDKFLKTITEPVENINESVVKLIEDMAETMYENSGVGLAATQVGSDKKILVYDISAEREKKEYQVLINPEIVSSEGEYLSEEEGCLSVPEYRANVKRSLSVVVKALDRNGQPLTIETEELHAVVLQHEIDHLNGILFIDRISSLKREIYKRRVKKHLKNK